MAIDESTRPSSSTAIQNVVKSALVPPYCSGNGNPNKPSSPMATTVSTGKVWVRSHSSAWGAISLSANARTTFLKSSCSELRSRSTRSIVGSGPMKVWVNGRLSSEEEARISPFDHAVLTGDGVFETLKVENRQAFAVRRHLERLARSAAGLGLDTPEDHTVREALAAVVAANDLVDGVARITLTGGTAPLGSERGPAGPTLIVAVGPPRGWGPSAAVAVAPWPRNERG